MGFDCACERLWWGLTDAPAAAATTRHLMSLLERRCLPKRGLAPGACAVLL